jgi:hypothetical protein
MFTRVMDFDTCGMQPPDQASRDWDYLGPHLFSLDLVHHPLRRLNQCTPETLPDMAIGPTPRAAEKNIWIAAGDGDLDRVRVRKVVNGAGAYLADGW